MKGYGLPRNDDVANPDVADIKHYGLKTAAGGRDYFKNKGAKAARRRIWKKQARNAGKKEIRETVEEDYEKDYNMWLHEAPYGDN